ncbi:MAG: hypothetical protein GY756_27795, partial [bacterium]|nr:hypothetical protein [bacterium]
QINDITLLHDILLRNLGCKWDMIGSLPSDWLDRDDTKEIQNKISGIIETESDYLFINDPGLCRFLPLWMKIFKDKDIEPLFIHMIRHPFEVAKSFKNSEGFDLMKSHLLWLNYNRDAFFATREYKHTVITYDGLLADPVNCMENIRKVFKIKISNTQENYKEIINFVQSNSKHHNLNELNNDDNSIYKPYVWIYNQLRLYQVKQIQEMTENTSSDAKQAISEMDNNLVKTFPIVNKKSSDIDITNPELIHTSDIFDNMLSVISKYEQDDLSRIIQHQ